MHYSRRRGTGLQIPRSAPEDVDVCASGGLRLCLKNPLSEGLGLCPKDPFSEGSGALPLRTPQGASPLDPCFMRWDILYKREVSCNPEIG